MALTKLNNNSLHAITDGSALKNVTGSVIQVQQNLKDSQVTVSSNDTWQQVTTCTITPKSSSSKIVVMFSAGGICSNTNDVGLQAIRSIGATDTTIVTRARQGYHNTSAYGSVPFDLKYLDSPATTSQITYQILARKAAGTLEVGSNGGVSSLNRASLMLMEIAG